MSVPSIFQRWDLKPCLPGLICSGVLLCRSSSDVAKDTVDSLLDIGRQLIPTNIVAAAAAPNYLGVMLFAIVFAFFLTSLGQELPSAVRSSGAFQKKH